MSAADLSRTFNAPPALDRWRSTALVVGAAGVVLCALGAFVNPSGFFRAYLVGYMFWTGVSVGSLALMMLHHLTGGAWGLVLRRLWEAATRTLPLMFVLFAPVAAAILLRKLYPWTFPELAHEHAIEHKAVYFNLFFYFGRTLFYFAVWWLLASYLSRWSLAQDRTAGDPDPRIRNRLQSVSGPGIVLFGLTVTFAAIDWGMSLEPEWFSTIYGLLIMAAWGLSSLAFMIVAAVTLSRHEPMARVYQPRHFHDHGKLLLALIMLWAYFSFSQFIIIWAANLPEEIPWYLRRLRHGWQYVALGLVVLHFALPFVLLLSRNLKRDARRLIWVALLVLVMRVVDLTWLVVPSGLQHAGEGAHHSDVGPLTYVLAALSVVGVGGLWIWYFAGQLKSRPLLPLGDRDLDDALAHKEGHH